MKYVFKFTVELNPETGSYDIDIDLPTELMETAKTNKQVTEFSNALSEATKQLCRMVSVYSGDLDSSPMLGDRPIKRGTHQNS